jgi:hypothetical protein
VSSGTKRRRKSIVGTQEEYLTRSAAERAAEHLRLSANAEINNHECPTMRGLIDRYIDQVLKFGVKWGYLNENPMGEKRVELPRGSTKRTTPASVMRSYPRAMKGGSNMSLFGREQ